MDIRATQRRRSVACLSLQHPPASQAAIKFRHADPAQGLNTPLRDLRGRLLVISSEEAVFPDLPGQWPHATLAGGGVKCWDMKDQAKARRSLEAYVARGGGEEDVAEGRYPALHCDVVCVPHTPSGVAKDMNAWLLQKLHVSGGWGHLGFVCVDFAHPELVDAIIAVNFLRRASWSGEQA